MRLRLDILQPSREKIASTQKSTCLDSLRLAKRGKSSKYADHIMLSTDAPIFHIARKTLRKAVTEAIDPKGRTFCLKVLAAPALGSYTANRNQVQRHHRKKELACRHPKDSNTLQQGSLLVPVN